VKKRLVKVVPVPVRQRPKKEEVYQQPQTQQSSMDYLVNQSYTEKLPT